MYEFIITCDGGSLGNGSESSQGYGSYMIAGPGKTNAITREVYGEGITNNEAEYKALIAALKHIADAFTAVGGDLKTISLTVRTDSQLVIGQVWSGWKVKALNLRPLVDEARALCEKFRAVGYEKISGVEMKKILGH
jgi:ribonuclease HI